MSPLRDRSILHLPVSVFVKFWAALILNLRNHPDPFQVRSGFLFHPCSLLGAQVVTWGRQWTPQGGREESAVTDSNLWLLAPSSRLPSLRDPVSTGWESGRFCIFNLQSSESQGTDSATCSHLPL